MREIKFRAWAHASKVMFKPDSNNDAFHFVEGWVYDLPNTTFMQYTGLKDKNGKEIYEGDIVQWTEALGGSVVRMATLYEGDDRVRTGWVVSDCFVDDKCEVIGNIYENPELLE